MNIILIGFMASGKSSVGRILAREMGWDYLDTDTEIERKTSLKIPELFKKYGEQRFRFEESVIVKKMSEVTKTIISTGGGMVVPTENWNNLQKNGVLIHLYVSLEYALQRVTKPQERPMLMKSDAEIEQLWRERLNIYNKANIIIDTTNKELDTVAAEILQQLKGGFLDHA